MAMFYVDEELKRLENAHLWDSALKYLDLLYKKQPSVILLNTIIGNAWYYFVEGAVEDKSYILEKSVLSLPLWKQYIEEGIKNYSDNPYFNFIAGYTLSLHGFLLGIEYEFKGIILMQRCFEISDGLFIKYLAENFLLNNKSKKYVPLKEGGYICKELFCENSLLNKYFHTIYGGYL